MLYNVIPKIVYMLLQRRCKGDPRHLLVTGDCGTNRINSLFIAAAVSTRRSPAAAAAAALSRQCEGVYPPPVDWPSRSAVLQGFRPALLTA